MENNKLKEEIGCIINDASCDWESDNGFKPIDNAMLTDQFYSLIKEASIEFTEWKDKDELKLRGSYENLFQYFIQNIYKQKEIE